MAKGSSYVSRSSKISVSRGAKISKSSASAKAPKAPTSTKIYGTKKIYS